MPAPLIEFDQVTKSFAGPLTRSRHQVFADVSFTVHEGEIVSLFGPSGCGKSTLLRMFYQLTPWDSGRITYQGTDITSLPKSARREMHRAVQVVFQDPRNAFNPRWLIRRSMAEPLKLFKIVNANHQALIGEKLALLGLEDGLLDRRPHQLSGGQLQRLALARCLLVSPRCLLLDEASSMLDLSVQARMMELVKKLRADDGISVLLISHDWDLVQAMSDRIYSFHDGTLSTDIAHTSDSSR